MKHPVYALITLTLALMIWSPTTSQAQDMGLSTAQAYEMSQNDETPVLFIDVRDPIEIMFIGFTDAVDANIPYLMADRSQWDSEKNRFRMYQNPDFIADIKTALAKRGMDNTATIITMCRSGSERGEPSARFLRENGFENARYVIHGFQGSATKDGKQKGLRIINGWQNSGLPWQAKPNPDKIYRMDSR
ncbi:rhodanese-like domain-containing protein [Thalassospira alkalitolerans]|uniref:rhodanese-like domain-containing protein n=1 Tax=Thalassospira alkalitolerans TaxID=1293890 RepID=UPI0030EF1986|tara:strand:- start:6007 stop:6573 length:567 start_codon:yes stop_codon:yes gene_type:complete